ncbi:hypothetical protein SAMN04487792_0582 [Lactobacillus bombicola]|uniref:Uncharacterized protein n=1 Tax=Lactobacillus bombicola TaxID=1505723 RepID=A0A1I1RUM9_9LACO|nr:MULTISPECIES: hypothetical protein [Lactobacillus]SFD37817.1 hypothetical protein SAMN04487792_0582 [Lactobacillus bombicola]
MQNEVSIRDFAVKLFCFFKNDVIVRFLNNIVGKRLSMTHACVLS